MLTKRWSDLQRVLFHQPDMSSLRFLARLLRVVVVVTSVLALSSSLQIVEEHDQHPADDCRSAARRFNDTLRTQEDQIIYEEKIHGEFL